MSEHRLLQDSIVFALSAAYKVGISCADRFFEPYGVDRRHVAVMAVLNIQFVQCSTGLLQTELLKATGLDRTTMVGLVDRLEELGWAKRTPHSTDRRANMVVILPQGVEFMLHVQPKVAQAEDDLLAKLQPDEQLELMRLLRKFVE